MKQWLSVLVLAVVLLGVSPVFAGQCSVYKTFSNEVLTASDLNNSLTQAAVTNSKPDCVDAYSATNAQMRLTTDPFPAGAESLATSLTGELQRLRYMLGHIVGQTYWYSRATPVILPGDLQLGVAASRANILYFYHHANSFFTSFQGSPTATATYLLPGALPTGAGQSLTSSTAGVMSWSAPTVRSYLAGLTLSNSGANIGIAVGQAADSTNVLTLTLASAFTKTTGTWASGTGNGGLFSGSIAASTWYHVCLIGQSPTTTDVGFDTSATCANKPGAWAYYRRIGSVRTDGASAFLPFVQDGDYFQWTNPTTLGLDINANNPGTAAVTRTLNVPTGVSVRAVVHCGITSDLVTDLYLSDLATTDVSGSVNTTPLSTAIIQTATAASNTSSQAIVRTNTSGQIRSRMGTSAASVTARIQTIGWYDSLGRDS